MTWMSHCQFGDYRDHLELLLAANGGPFDCMCMDPPYILDTKGGGKYRKARTTFDEIENRGLDKGFDLNLISWKHAHSCVVFVSDDQLLSVGNRLKQNYYRQKLLIVRKRNPQPVANKNYQPEIEMYWHAWSKGYHPQGDLADKKRVTDVSRPEKFGYENDDGIKLKHPTVKPLSLMRKIMKNVAGKTVFDPFMGTGTTGVAALEAGKIFIGCEIFEPYYNIAIKRLHEASL